MLCKVDKSVQLQASRCSRLEETVQIKRHSKCAAYICICWVAGCHNRENYTSTIDTKVCLRVGMFCVVSELHACLAVPQRMLRVKKDDFFSTPVCLCQLLLPRFLPLNPCPAASVASSPKRNVISTCSSSRDFLIGQSPLSTLR